MKKKRASQDLDAELVFVVSDLIKSLEVREKSKLLPKDMVDDLITTFTDILKDNTTFRKMIADPKSDLTDLEPIIKKMMKKKNGRHKS